MRPARVVVVEDHPLVREALKTLIESTDDFALLGAAADALSAVPLLDGGPELVLLDLELPGESGLRLLSTMRVGTRVLVLTSHTHDTWAIAALRAGAHGYLTKSATPEQVLRAMRAVVAGDSYLEASLARRLATASPAVAVDGPLALTAREFEVLSAVAQAMTNEEIASALGISERTVKSHVSALLAKLGAKDRTEVAVMAWRQGLVRRDGA